MTAAASAASANVLQLFSASQSIVIDAIVDSSPHPNEI
jgi:hypothetical protein